MAYNVTLQSKRPSNLTEFYLQWKMRKWEISRQKRQASNPSTNKNNDEGKGNYCKKTPMFVVHEETISDNSQVRTFNFLVTFYGIS